MGGLGATGVAVRPALGRVAQVEKQEAHRANKTYSYQPVTSTRSAKMQGNPPRRSQKALSESLHASSETSQRRLQEKSRQHESAQLQNLSLTPQINSRRKVQGSGYGSGRAAASQLAHKTTYTARSGSIARDPATAR